MTSRTSLDFPLFPSIGHLQTERAGSAETGRGASELKANFHAKRIVIGKDTSSTHFPTFQPKYHIVDRKAVL
jgi:hypothetical protein